MDKLFVLLACAVTFQAHAVLDPMAEDRYCGPPTRLADGSIRRRSDVLSAFRKLHPCPSTLRTTGACPGWAINHVIPLACGGCDAVGNLQWMRDDVKALHDRYERKVNAATPPVADTPSCKLQLVP